MIAKLIFTGRSESASEKYGMYKPILDEIERIQREAEVDVDLGSRKVTAGGEGRNRR